MRGALVSWLFLVALAPPGVSIVSAQVTRSVVTREDIESAGLLRFGDVVRLASGWDVVTRDGFRWQPVAAGTRPLDSYTSILVDGVPALTSRFGVEDVNRLPISIAQIDSVVFREDRGLDGRGGGVIEIFTRRPPGPLGAGLRGGTGGESGDQGPFVFVDDDAVNVDRIGHDGTFFGHTRRGSLLLTANVTDQTLVGTDPGHEERWRLVSVDEPPNIEHRGYALRARDDTGALTLAADLTTSDLDDIFFLDVLGRELPVESERHSARASFTHRLGADLHLAGAALHTVNTLDAQRNPDEVDLDWRHSDTMLDVGVTRRARASRVDFGVGFEHRKASTSDALSIDSIWMALWRTRVDRRHGSLTSGARMEMGAGPDVDGPMIDVAIESRLRGVGRGAITARARYTRAPFALSRDVWPWIDRGLGASLGPLVDPSIDGEPGATRRFVTAMGWSGAPRSGLRLELETFLHVLRGATQEVLAYSYEPATERFVSPASLATDLSGSLAGVRLHGQALFASGRISLDAGYRLQSIISADAPLARAWRRSARHVLNARVTFRPEENLSLTLLLNARDEAEWHAYFSVAQQSRGRYGARTPSFAAIDGVLTKWLAARKATVSLRLENLGDATVRTHPVGPTRRFGAFATFSIYLW